MFSDAFNASEELSGIKENVAGNESQNFATCKHTSQKIATSTATFTHMSLFQIATYVRLWLLMSLLYSMSLIASLDMTLFL